MQQKNKLKQRILKQLKWAMIVMMIYLWYIKNEMKMEYMKKQFVYRNGYRWNTTLSIRKTPSKKYSYVS